MRTHLTSVGDLLFGQIRVRILALLYGAPDETFFVRQIARQVETSVGAVQRELALLADAGQIKRSAVGSQVFYQANQELPEFPELRALLAKTTGVFQMLKAALAPLSFRISVAFVYGSVGIDYAHLDTNRTPHKPVDLEAPLKLGYCAQVRFVATRPLFAVSSISLGWPAV
jgi:hypothetical protein